MLNLKPGDDITPRADSAVLRDLCDLADAALASAVPGLGLRDRIAAIKIEIARAMARPCDGVRAVDATAWLVFAALEAIPQTADPARQARFEAVVSLLLPHLRDDILIALKNEMETYR